MALNKIANHRNNFHNYSVEKLKDSGGTELTLGSTSDGGFLIRNGSSALNSFIPACANLYINTVANESSSLPHHWYALTGSKSLSVNEVNFSASGTGNNALVYSGSTYSNHHNKFLVNGQWTLYSDTYPVVVSMALANSTHSSAILSQSVSSVAYLTQSIAGANQGCQLSLSSIVTLTASQVLTPFWKTSVDNVILQFQSSSMTVVQL